mmetsp:Transcript_51627/g.102592  ORF Transcript_51627/g.102592 Transcript_51627/m.102592 type:complete len:574 (-) Transcript_51627:97-1818(-)
MSLVAWQLPLGKRLVAAVTAAGAAVLIGRPGLCWLRELLFPKGRPLSRQAKLRRRLRVAIVGAGVGGCSLAHWLRDLYGEDLQLTIISDGPIGGRCQSVELADGRSYEGGAAIISELNEYMIGFMKRLGLSERYFAGLSAPLGIFDGQRLLVREADPKSALLGLRQIAAAKTAWRFISRYGFLSLRRLKGLMRHSAAPEFPRLYGCLRKGQAFETVQKLLNCLGPECVRLASVQASEWLCEAPPAGGGLPENVVNELVTGGMRSNYGGQGCENLHTLVGLVSIAGGFASRCFPVRGGNQQIPKGLLDLACPDRLLAGATAQKVRRASSDGGIRGWEILVDIQATGEAMKGAVSPDNAGGELSNEGPFDIVVVAHPLERSRLKIEDNATEAQLACNSCGTGRFRRCVTHFLRGALRCGNFIYKDIVANRTDINEAPPLAILTAAGSVAPFYSIGLQLPVDATRSEAKGIVDAALHGETCTFKVFAGEPLSESQLDGLFEKREGSTTVLDWYAYPEYEPLQQLGSFVLDGEDGSLLYLNAIEQVASAMEMSAIAARNAANLVVKFVDKHRGENRF